MFRRSRTLWHSTRVLDTDIAIYRVDPDATAGAPPSFIAVHRAYPWLGAFYNSTTEPTTLILTQGLERWRQRYVVYLTLAGLLVALGLASS
jgi:hypothetical protein